MGLSTGRHAPSRNYAYNAELERKICVYILQTYRLIVIVDVRGRGVCKNKVFVSPCGMHPSFPERRGW